MKSKLTNKAIFSLQRLILVATLLNRFREIMSLLQNKIFLMTMFPMKPKQGLFRLKALAETEFVKGFPPDKVKIDGKEICKSIYIGICNDVLKGDVKAIIPYELVKISE